MREIDRSPIMKAMTDQSCSTKLHPAKENFIDTLMHAGETRLQNGDESGLQLLKAAGELEPTDKFLFHKQGLAIFDYACNGHPKAFHIANKKFKRATILDPQLFETWVSWGNSLFILGSASGEHHYFLDAREKFEMAIELSQDVSDDLLFDLFWNYGLTLGQIALKSEDPTDLQLAHKAFYKATTLKEGAPVAFWCNFGHLCLSLFHAIGSLDYLNQALQHYKQASCISTTEFQPWVFLGDASALLFSITHEFEHFDHASECYAAAATIAESEAYIWLKWATLLGNSGRQLQDPKTLHASIEKCHKAKAAGANPIELTCVWAESLSALGHIKNRLKHMRKAENMMDELMEAHPQNAAVQYSHGLILLNLADYFNCMDIYFHAAEAFQKATSLNRTFHAAWHALGTTYTLLAPMEDNTSLQLERAVRFFSKALKLYPDVSYHFDLGHALYLLAEEKESTDLLARALYHIEEAIDSKPNAPYLHTEWLFVHAAALSLSGHLNDQESHFVQALDRLHQLLEIDPTFANLHCRFALTYNFYADHAEDPHLFQRAFHHFRIAHQNDPDNDALLVDWAISLIHLYELDGTTAHLDTARSKLIQAAKMGNTDAFYTLAGVYALRNQQIESIYYLNKAVQFHSLPELSEVVDDVWLESLHSHSEFHTFIAHIQRLREESSK